MKTRSALKYLLAASSLILSTYLLASAQSVTTQPASESKAWGDPVDGIQLRIAVSKDQFPAHERPGQLPRLEMQLRNMGNETATTDLLNLKIEIDGIWHSRSEALVTGETPVSPVLSPGSESQAMPVGVWAIDAVNDGQDSLLYTSDFHGHVLRLRIPVSIAGARGASRITLVSNAITVTTSRPGVPALLNVAWGDAVDGIQLHLSGPESNPRRLSTDPPEIPWQLHYLAIWARNTDEDNFSLNADRLSRCDIEIDGIWYRPVISSSPGVLGGMNPGGLDAGMQTSGVPVLFQGSLMRLDANGRIIPSEKFNLQPGEHSIRVRPTGGIENSAHQTITPVSNAITIETIAVPAAQSGSTQPASEADAWGDAVDGIQLRLGVSESSPPQLPGELPGLEMQMRNTGTETAAFDEECVLRLDIEIDGAWYTPEASICSNAPAPTAVTPGKQSEIIRINISETYRAVDPHPGLPSLIQGRIVPADERILSSYRHSIRIRTFVNVTGGDVQSSTMITLLSNAITAEIP